MSSTQSVDVPIDEVSQLWITRQRLVQEIEERKDAIRQLDDLLKEKLPDEDHVTARIDGRPVFTFAYTQRWSEAKFKEEYPDLAQRYSTPQLVDRMDWGRFAQEHPALARQFQVRALTPWRSRKGS